MPEAPAQVGWHACGEHEMPAHERWLAPQELEIAGRMRFAKRRSEFLLARFTAKSAVAERMAWPREPETLSRIRVTHRKGGAPELRVDGETRPLSISLSDRAGWAVCALAPPTLRLGIDLELVEPRSDGFVADYFTAPERERVAAAGSELERDRLANLIWCAKESALKVLGEGLRRDTRDVSVWLEGDDPDAWQPLRVDESGGARFRGWWRCFGPFVLTLAADAPLAEPASILEPPALLDATPRHSWLEQPLVSGA